MNTTIIFIRGPLAPLPKLNTTSSISVPGIISTMCINISLSFIIVKQFNIITPNPNYS